MTPHEYQLETRRTRPAGESKERALAHYALGLCEEAGELAGVIKKHVFYGHPLDRDKLVKEAGDVLWYLASLLETTGSSFADEVAAIQEIEDWARHEGEVDDAGPLQRMFRVLENCHGVAEIAERVVAGVSADGVRFQGAFLVMEIVGILAAFDITLPEVMAANVAKLRARYPQGWTAADAAERKDEGPGLRFCACGRIQPECDGSRKACVATGKAKEAAHG